jgi:hypothetical protein
MGSNVVFWSLGPSQGWPVKRMPGAMRFPEDLRRTVLFLGHEDDRPDRGGIECIGTAFLVRYKDCVHLVTAKHVAMAVADGPFLIRVNMLQGGAENRRTDKEVRWHSHEDRDVDLAASLFQVDFTGCDVKSIPSELIADAEAIASNGIGVGDQAYAVGLFRVLHGRKRNLQVVHTGNLALLPGEERVPVDDWERPGAGERKWVEGYLVEGNGLQGLSGAPVFVRPTFISEEFNLEGGRQVHAMLSRLDLLLLGIWQGAWDAKTDALLTADRGREMRVSVGMGVVVPASKLIEVLEMPKLKTERDAIYRQRERDGSASLDAVPPANEKNPKHREDFNSLLRAAVQKPQQED